MKKSESRYGPQPPAFTPAFIRIMVAMCLVVLFAVFVKNYSRHRKPSRIAAAPGQSEELRADTPNRATRRRTADDFRPANRLSAVPNAVPALHDFIVVRSLRLDVDPHSGSILSAVQHLGSYRIPSDRASELHVDFNSIVELTNGLAVLEGQVASIRQGLQKDTRDYLVKAQQSGATVESQRQVALQKLMEM